MLSVQHSGHQLVPSENGKKWQKFHIRNIRPKFKVLKVAEFARLGPRKGDKRAEIPDVTPALCLAAYLVLLEATVEKNRQFPSGSPDRGSPTQGSSRPRGLLAADFKYSTLINWPCRGTSMPSSFPLRDKRLLLVDLRDTVEPVKTPD